jgi:hypothetical protein
MTFIVDEFGEISWIDIVNEELDIKGIKVGQKLMAEDLYSVLGEPMNEKLEGGPYTGDFRITDKFAGRFILNASSDYLVMVSLSSKPEYVEPE